MSYLSSSPEPRLSKEDKKRRAYYARMQRTKNIDEKNFTLPVVSTKTCRYGDDDYECIIETRERTKECAQSSRNEGHDVNIYGKDKIDSQLHSATRVKTDMMRTHSNTRVTIDLESEQGGKVHRGSECGVKACTKGVRMRSPVPVDRHSVSTENTTSDLTPRMARNQKVEKGHKALSIVCTATELNHQQNVRSYQERVCDSSRPNSRTHATKDPVTRKIMDVKNVYRSSAHTDPCSCKVVDVPKEHRSRDNNHTTRTLSSAPTPRRDQQVKNIASRPQSNTPRRHTSAAQYNPANTSGTGGTQNIDGTVRLFSQSLNDSLTDLSIDENNLTKLIAEYPRCGAIDLTDSPTTYTCKSAFLDRTESKFESQRSPHRKVDDSKRSKQSISTSVPMTPSRSSRKPIEKQRQIPKSKQTEKDVVTINLVDSDEDELRKTSETLFSTSKKAALRLSVIDSSRFTRWNEMASKDMMGTPNGLESLRRSIAGIDDTTPRDQSGKKSKFPKLTQAAMDRVKKVWSRKYFQSTDVVAQGLRLQVTQDDLCRLQGLDWLNDAVVNMYMALINERARMTGESSVHCFSSLFLTKLNHDGYGKAKRWTNKVDLFSKDYVVVPVHEGCHWCVAVINFRLKRFEYYDSMGQPNPGVFQVLRKYIQMESEEKKNRVFDLDGWVDYMPLEVTPRQNNGSDCGVFTCQFSEYCARGCNFDFTQADMPYFRMRMAHEILELRLLNY
eukprot:CFRG4516T1